MTLSDNIKRFIVPILFIGYLFYSYPSYSPFPELVTMLISRFIYFLNGVPVVYYNNVIYVMTHDYGMRLFMITPDCSGAIIYGLFTIVIFFIPNIKLINRMYSFIIFIPLIFSVNFIRIYTDIFIGINYDSTILYVFHNFIGQIIIFFILIISFSLLTKYFGYFDRMMDKIDSKELVEKRDSMEIKGRFLFFDIVRIIAILMVVYQHINSSLHISVPSFLFMGETLGIGKIGVILFVITCGAVQFISSQKTEFTIKNTLLFYYKKFIRLYPALWFSFIIAIIVEPQYIKLQTLSDWIIQISGTTVYFKDITNQTTFLTLINPISYFISLIIGLYLVYPLIHKIVKHYPDIVLLISILISAVAIQKYNIGINSGNPLAYFMYFTFGIYIVNKGYYPKTTISLKNFIVFISNLTFYIFLTHGCMLNYWLSESHNYNIIMFVISSILISVLLMLVDNMIQLSIRNFSIKYGKHKQGVRRNI